MGMSRNVRRGKIGKNIPAEQSNEARKMHDTSLEKGNKLHAV